MLVNILTRVGIIILLLFLAEPAQADLVYSTYVGGAGFEGAREVAIDSQGNVVVAGITDSPGFLGPAGVENREDYTTHDVFLLKLTPDLSTLIAATYFGGSESDIPQDMLVGAGDELFLSLTTESPDFPTIAGAYDTTHNGALDAALVRISPNLDSILASTFIGGGNNDAGNALVLLDNDVIVLAGGSHSDDFPTTPGAYDDTHNGYWDAFVLKIAGKLSSTIEARVIRPRCCGEIK